MFSVVIADDEPLIIRGLMKMIDWEKLNARVVGTSRNGEQLIEQIESLSPDIIISDISMPVKSGIDVIQYLKENRKMSKTIFLSAYQEFEYAKQALNHGVVEYLLKPATKEELESALLKAEKALQENLSLEYLRENKGTAHSVFKSVGSEDEREELELRLKREIPNHNGDYAVVCFSAVKKAESNQFSFLRFTAFKKIEEFLHRESKGVLLKREQDYCYVLFYYEKGEMVRVREEVRMLIGRMKKDLDMCLTAGIGKQIADLSDLKFSYKTAEFACKLYYFQQEEIICYDKISKDYQKSFEDYNLAYERFIKAVLHQEPEWESDLLECLSLIRELHFGNREVAENRCVTLLLEFLRELGSYYQIDLDERKKYENFVTDIRELETWQQVQNVVHRYLKQFIEKQVFVKLRDDDNEVIKKIKLYIRENYDQDLNLKSMSKEFYMNQYYFSLFFKQKAGMNFKDYLVEVRMQKAMEVLLMNPDMKTQELSRRVGYRDAKAFAERFKQYYGESPQNYKKSRRF